MTDDRHVTVDLRGLVCPEPVIRTKKIFENNLVERVEALVDDDINVQNLSRLARSIRVGFQSLMEGKHHRVVLERSADGAQRENIEPETLQVISGQTAKDREETSSTVVLINKNTFGEGDPEFSEHLLNIFLQTMYDSGHRPRAILMANKGVKLMGPNSPFAKVLEDFQKAGCDVLACGLCVEYYGLKELVAKEQITNMFAICEYMQAADKVITP
jgi:selenium metabolism protein YedF